jgi:hypothetical protein
MNMNGGDLSVVDLPLSDPACSNSECIAFDAASNQSQLVTPWAGQFEYGHWTTWYNLAIIFVVVLWRAFGIWSDRTNQDENRRTTGPSLWQIGLAASRYIPTAKGTMVRYARITLVRCASTPFHQRTLPESPHVRHSTLLSSP